MNPIWQQQKRSYLALRVKRIHIKVQDHPSAIGLAKLRRHVLGLQIVFGKLVALKRIGRSQLHASPDFDAGFPNPDSVGASSEILILVNDLLYVCCTQTLFSVHQGPGGWILLYSSLWHPKAPVIWKVHGRQVPWP